MSHLRSQKVGFLILFLLLLGGIGASFYLGGSVTTRVDDPSAAFIFTELRLPKTITAIVAGAALAMSGLVLQLIFRNPLAGPYVLGVSSGASLSVAIAVLTGGAMGIMDNQLTGRALMVGSAIAGGFAVTLIILLVAGKMRNNVVLLLAGLMFAQICGALQSSLEYFADPSSLKIFVLWGMGSLSGTTLSDLPLLVALPLLSFLVMLFYVKPLNAMLLGEDYARSAGIDYLRARFALLLLSSVLTGVVTAYCGPIAFVGIAVPVLSRMIFRSADQRVHLYSCALLGAIILLLADAVSYSVRPGASLPINMITTLAGAPVVLYLLFHLKKW